MLHDMCTFHHLANDTSSHTTFMILISTFIYLKHPTVLDDAELALKNMAAGNADIDKQEIYKLMQEHIAVQRSLWKFKQIAAAFFVLIVILGIANVGTSFAAAIIAKDTTASGGNLKEKGENGATLGTQTFADQTDVFVEPSDTKLSKLGGTCSGFYKKRGERIVFFSHPTKFACKGGVIKIYQIIFCADEVVGYGTLSKFDAFKILGGKFLKCGFCNQMIVRIN